MRELYEKLRLEGIIYGVAGLGMMIAAFVFYFEGKSYLVVGGVGLLSFARGCVIAMRAFALVWDMEDLDGDDA